MRSSSVGLHGQHLAVPTTGSAALHAEYRSQTGFPQADETTLANLANTIGESHSSGGLALSHRRRRNSGHQYQFALRPAVAPVTEFVGQLGLGSAVADYRFSGNTQPGCHFGHAGPMAEALLLGNVALKVGRRIEWDPVKFQVTNCPEANQYVRREYRKGWTL